MLCFTVYKHKHTTEEDASWYWDMFYHTIVWSMLPLNNCWQKAALFTTNTLPLGWHRKAVAAQTLSILPHSRLLTSLIIFILYILNNVFYVVLTNVTFKLKMLNRRHMYAAVGSREWDQDQCNHLTSLPRQWRPTSDFF